MAIEKGLYAAPEGLEMDDEEGTELEIEIIDPEAVVLDDGSVEVTLIPDAEETDMVPFDGNLAEAMADGEMSLLASDLVSLVQADMDSRKDWSDTFVKGLEVLGFKY
jgi:hypothetical protein